MVDYSTNASIRYLKMFLQAVLIAMICYQAHLATRDTDKFTFENRIHESYLFLYKNHPNYRLYLFNEAGIDRRNCTADQLENMIDFLAPATNQAHAQWGIFTSTIILLDSRFGCLLTLMHAGALAIFHNMYSLRPYVLKYVEWRYRDGTPSYKPEEASPCMPEKEMLESELHIDKSTAFSEQFMKQQTTWKCGLDFVSLEILLSILLFIALTIHKRDDTEGFKLKNQHLFKKEIEAENNNNQAKKVKT